ncbi:MAG TPA: tRNA lysidine(34) synthetase TilS [Povalibacter sp.]|uniref:tRNA lysidine(34) synthetase TilS n=1 Tax=Povalibacter sp. TaxID=1962978 RepID=UPI002C1F5611|nr:tRNA lysidine(34) synthetase TilS [Povalibacter sp.]HMN47439.1 tRNA lysidine(34) synthetase TilS [Povalibacter sp.]
MIFSPAALLDCIHSTLPAGASGTLRVAFSGGLDSTVLLAALQRACAARPGYRLRAIHVDHGLHADSARWTVHCENVAQRLGIDFASKKVAVSPADEGLEAAARHARYAALRECLQPGDALLTAHHADDQFETLMLALLRGAGLPGLAAMPACREFAPGWHLRPLLEFTRPDLEDWARAEGLAWIDDPSNDLAHFDRNFLRHQILPLLQTRWPSAVRTAVRTARHAGEGMALLDEFAIADLASAATGPCLKVDVLAGFSDARRRNLLRYWSKLRGARAPSTRKLLALEHDMLAAQEDRLPVIEWDGFEVRRFRGLLYGDRVRRGSSHEAVSFDWEWSRPLVLPDKLGSLHVQPGHGAGLARALLPRTLRVAFRQGGEVLQPAGDPHRRDLKKLLQAADILPWWRNRLPLLWVDDRLAAVGDLWTADEFAADADEEGVQVVWQGKPRIQAQRQTAP